MHEYPPHISQAVQLVGTWSLVCAEYREIPPEGGMPAEVEITPGGAALEEAEILPESRALMPMPTAEGPSGAGDRQASAREGPAGGGAIASGSVVSYLGANPHGSLIYTAEGFMSVQVHVGEVWGRCGCGPAQAGFVTGQ